ncbi:MAG TPA: sugar-binding protein [Pyrinomonadaceae bacterium]|jgi:ribose transport system substrate-binding protein|nr:sugar-binding protein [Pyrinomonadaceae bacterium]
MKRSARRQFACSLAFIIALFIGCATPPKPPKAVKTVAFITNTSSDFWKIARKGCEKADAELSDVAVAFKTTNEGTTDEQNRLIRQALDRDEADAIAISPIDPAKQKNAINDAARRALVITQDSDAPDTERALYLGADNRAAGRQAGELVLKALPQGGKIMVFVGKRDVQNARERFDGLKEALSGSKVEVIDLLADDSDPVHAMENAADTLKKYPDIAGMVGLWSYNGPSILRALRSMDKIGKVKVVCFDDERETLDGIKEGAIFGTVAQQPFEYGYQAVQAAAKILKGDRSVIPATKTILIPTVVIQRNNLEDYTKRMNQLLGTTSG